MRMYCDKAWRPLSTLLGNYDRRFINALAKDYTRRVELVAHQPIVTHPMPRPVIDLSILCDPAGSGPLSGHPLPSHIEPSGPDLPRQRAQQVCYTLPYAFEYNEIGVDVCLGDSLRHAHADSLLVNKVTILSEVPMVNAGSYAMLLSSGCRAGARCRSH